MQNNYQDFWWLEFEVRREENATLNSGINNYWTVLPKKMVTFLFRRAFNLGYMFLSERYNLVQVYAVVLVDLIEVAYRVEKNNCLHFMVL